MSRTLAVLLFGAGIACMEPQRPEGSLRTLPELIDEARAGDADASAIVALRGQPLKWLSSPYGAGTSTQESDRDGLVVEPAYADAHPAAIVTTEIWDGFPRVWAQPLYVPVTGFDAQGGPQRVPGSFSIFGVGSGSRFYSPFWQVMYVTVPAGFPADGLRSATDVLSSRFPITTGELRFCPQATRESEVSHPVGTQPVHPFTGDVLQSRLASQAWSDGALTWYIDFGPDKFRVNDANNVVNEVALFRFALQATDGSFRMLDLPAVVGTGPFRAPRAADAPDGIPRFGALRPEYVASLTPLPGGPTPGIFVSASHPELRELVTGKLGSAYVPQPSTAAENLPEREQYTLRVALDGSCFSLTDFPNACTWLDSQASVEANLPVSAFTDTKRFTAGAFVFFDGVAP
jgi:hypothetical protein